MWYCELDLFGSRPSLEVCSSGHGNDHLSVVS